MKLFNCHTHTHNSHDGNGTVEELCEKALKNDLFGFAVTDHLDCEFFEDASIENTATASFNETLKAKEKYQDSLFIACGIEIGEAIYAPAFAKKIIKKHDWDVILGSVHAVRYKNLTMPFSLIDFSVYDEEMISDYIEQYFTDVLEMINTCDFDVLSHITVVLRYIVYKYSKKVNVSSYYPQIREILRKIILLDKTLEINTSGMSNGYLMPDTDILRMYKSLGGKNITLGSDSHIPQNLTDGLFSAATILKDEGFDTLTYYKNREPFVYKI